MTCVEQGAERADLVAEGENLVGDAVRGPSNDETFDMDTPKIKKLTPQMRREQIREYLLDAATAIFAARGFQKASLDEIADAAAGFTKGAIYSNFDGKEDLILAVIKRREEDLLKQLFAVGQEPPDDRATGIEVLTEVYRRLNPTAEEWMILEEFVLYALRDPKIKAKYDATGHAAFEALMSMVDGLYKSAGVELPLEVESIARLYLAIFDGLARQKMLDPDRVTDDLFAELVVFVHEAVLALGGGKPKRRPRVDQSKRQPPA